MNTTHKKNTTGLIRKWFTRGMACMALLFAAGSAQAASDSWKADVAGNWNAIGSWLGNQTPGSTSTDNSDVATFSFTLTGERIVTVDNPRYIGGISFENTSAYRYYLQTGLLRLNSGGTIQTLSGNGNHMDTIGAAIQISGTSGATASFTAGASSFSSILRIGAVTGSATSGNTTTLTLNGANTGTNVIAGTIGNGSGGGKLAIVKDGGGVWTLSGANTFTGGVTLNNGTLKLENAAALGNAASSVFTIAGGNLDSTTITLGNYTQNWNGDFTYVGSGSLNLGAGAVTLNGNRQVTVSSNAIAAVGAIGGAFSLTKLGAGRLTLSGANTYTGGTTINAGTLRVENATALGASTSAVSVAEGAVLDVNAVMTGTNAVTLNGSGIGGTGALVNFGSIDATYAGTVTLGSDSTIATGPSNKRLNVNGTIGGSGNLTLKTNNNGPVTLANNVNNTGTISNSGTGSNASVISGNIGTNVTDIVQNSTGSGLTLSGSNTFSGNIYIKAGTLADKLGAQYGYTANWGPSTATIYLGDAIVGADATLATQSNAGYTGAPSSSNPINVVSGGGARTISQPPGVSAQAWLGGNITLYNNLQFINNGGKIIKTSGTITGNGNLTFASTTGSGTIELSGASINPVGIITNSSGGTGAITISGTIGANVTAVVQNSATSQMTLTSTNTYNGPTTINAGTLFVNGTNTVGSGTAGTYTVKSGGTLGGKGKIDLSAVNGSVVVEAGGKLSPGSAANTVGTSTLALGATGTLDISAAAGTPGTLVFDLVATNASDLITLASGKLNIGIGALSLASLQIGGILDASQTTYTLVHTVDGITGTMMGGGTSVSGTLPGSSVGAILSISGDGKDLVLNLTSFPPPKAVTWKGNIFSQWESVTTNWVVTGTSTPTNFMYSDTVTFDDSGSATATITSIAPVTPASVSVSNSVNAYTISAAIAGSGSLTKLGTNKLTLTGSNTFTGNIYIKEGTLANLLNVRGINGNGNWGPATSTIYLGDATVGANATLQDNGDGNGLSDSSHPINVVSGAGTRTISYGGSGAGLVNGPITLNNNLTVGNNGNKQFILGSSVTGTGNLTIASTIANATWPFQLTGAINPVGAITNSTTSICPTVISGVIGSNVTAVVQNSTSSKLVLSGTNNLYAGTTTVILGTLETQKTNSLGVASSVIIATNNGDAKMYLNFTGTNTITSLKINGINLDRGVYGTNAPLGNLYFSGTGKLNVLKGPVNGTLIRFY